MIDWGKSYTLIFLCTNESKLRVFQFKLVHRKLATNYFLFKIGIKCSFCKESLETLLHLFWECPFVKSFWNEISNWMKNSSCFLNEEFSFLSCIGLVNDTTNLSRGITSISPNKKALTLHGNSCFKPL